MPKGYPLTTCKDCRRPIANRADLSATGLCVDCGPRRQREEIEQLIACSGPHFEHWQRQCARKFQWVRLDDDAAPA